ncbi:MAG: nucleotidyltransferase family protein [Candidatus Levybacteria bacterium]|nr:nucleotidyltransferase family protein [Candidatus Levybacteria bacterium]
MAKNRLWYPTSEQEILLKISLADNREEAQSHWEQWNSRNSIFHMQSESYLLLQSAISNLLSLGVPIEPKLRNISHKTAVRNLIVIRVAQLIAGEFSKNKIPLYALKGLALFASGIYEHSDMRAMHDIDLYVSDHYHKRALKILLSAGWTKSSEDGHSVVLAQQGFPGKLDLHRKPLWFKLTPRVIANIEKDTEIFSFKDNPIRIMKPELQLVHIIVHGARWGVNDYSSNTTTGAPHLRWIIDAHYLIKKYHLDWQCVLEWAKTFEAVIQVKDALELLQRDFKIAIPSSVIVKLKNIPKTRTQKLHAKYSMAYKTPKYFKIPRSLQASFHAWLLQNRTPEYINALTPSAYIREFGKFLKVGFSLDKKQSIPAFIIKKILSKPKLLFP